MATTRCVAAGALDGRDPMLGDTPGHWDRHGAEGGSLGFREAADPLGDPLEPRTVVCRQSRQGLVELCALVK